jgi:mycothiol synthase
MQLLMRRPDLVGLPAIPALPPDSLLREYREADGPGIAAIMQAAFNDPEWTLARVQKDLVDDPTVRTVFVIEQAGRVVATASSRLLPDAYPGSGYVHWVGADPELRGRKLGWIVTLATLHDFVRLGCRDAVLETDDFRLPAIVTYRRLGFEPVYRDETHRERWQKIEEQINEKGLSEQAQILDTNPGR